MEKAKRKEKEPFRIDFLSENKVDEKLLFRPSASTVNMTKAQAAVVDLEKYLLPKDFKYSAKDFFSLFCKPNVMVTN